MSLQIVYGKAGTGKSFYCFEKIKEELNKGNKIYIITPEQFSFTAERMLLEKVGVGAVINAEVLTFDRMAYRLMNEVYGAKKVRISSTGKAILIYNILLKNAKNLSFLSNTEENVEMIATQITEFKKHKITIEDLKNAIKENEKNEYLKLKLTDMLIVYEEFENIIQNKYIDENDSFSLLNDNLDKTNIFKNAIFYIDEFVGFTKQEYSIIKKLLRTSKKNSCNSNFG